MTQFPEKWLVSPPCSISIYYIANKLHKAKYSESNKIKVFFRGL